MAIIARKAYGGSGLRAVVLAVSMRECTPPRPGAHYRKFPGKHLSAF